MVLGASGVPWDPPDHDLETWVEKPNSRRFYAGLSPNGCWIVLSWVSFRGLSLALGGHPYLGGAYAHFRRDHLCLGMGFIVLPPSSPEASVSRGGFAVPFFGGTLGLFCGGNQELCRAAP